jgi:hypothetical protein
MRFMRCLRVRLGHFDLTNSMGILGRFDHPEFLAAVDKLVVACRGQSLREGLVRLRTGEGQ